MIILWILNYSNGSFTSNYVLNLIFNSDFKFSDQIYLININDSSKKLTDFLLRLALLSNLVSFSEPIEYLTVFFKN